MNNKTHRILVVDDEESIRWGLEQSLKREGHEVLTAQNSAEALAVARRHQFDLIVLDIVMPGKDGLWLCRQLRRSDAFRAVPIMFLTVRSDIADRVKGLDQGGDDYIPKPFHLEEFNARVRALLRRNSREVPGPRQSAQRAVLEAGPITLAIDTREIRVGSAVTKLTSREFDLLHHFMLHIDEVFSSQELLQQVWGYGSDSRCTSLVRWHIKAVREKIEPVPSSPIYLQTVSHHGYVLRFAAPEAQQTT